MPLLGLKNWSSSVSNSHTRQTVRPRLEYLESREVPTVFLVTSNANTGTGTLRQAILDSNAKTCIRFDILEDSISSPSANGSCR
jgi:hypothetical protein